MTNPAPFRDFSVVVAATTNSLGIGKNGNLLFKLP